MPHQATIRNTQVQMQKENTETLSCFKIASMLSVTRRFEAFGRSYMCEAKYRNKFNKDRSHEQVFVKAVPLL